MISKVRLAIAWHLLVNQKAPPLSDSPAKFWPLAPFEGARWSSGINAAIGARGPEYYLPCSDLGQVVNLSGAIYL